MFWYNGYLIEGDTLPLNISDPGLIYGATVFTTLRVYGDSLDHPLTQWSSHCDRLRNSIAMFNWIFPDWERIRQGAQTLLKYCPVLRLVIFQDGREWITGRSLPPQLAERQQQGILGWVAEDLLYKRPLAEHKTGNYLGAWLALQKAQQIGVQEAILIDTEGNWLETATGNLWGGKGGYWYTPDLRGGMLPGIGRSHLLECLKRENIPVIENQWTAEFIQELEIIAYSNCVVEIVPFRGIVWQGNTLDLNPHHPALEDLKKNYFVE